MKTPSSRRDLHTKIDSLSQQGVDVVTGVVNAILSPAHTELLSNSWLTTPSWAEGFLARLRAHHALSREPLSTTQFEAAFESACESAGWTVGSSVSATQRFFDTTITLPGAQPKRISLKASSAAGMNKKWIHISKLTEAAWIQDTRIQTKRRDKIVELFKEYREITDCIIMLRGFKSDNAVDYELIEIPTALFDAVDQLDTATAQLSTIPIPVNIKPPHLKIRIDRSDAKITLTGIQVDVCDVHGRWKLEAQH